MKTKVAVKRCRSYDERDISTALKEALDLIGGMGSFVKKSDKVLIKPNLLSARTPDEAITTHPEFVRYVVRLVKESGGIPAIGDSPGSFFTVKSVDEVYEKTGMKKVADEEGIELLKFDEIDHIKGYPIARALKEFNVVVNLPKFKTHTLAMFTGAVKNVYGFVPGLMKVQFHKKAPNIAEFCKTLADIFAIIKPALSIMDGVTGMDGDGPAAGRVREIGYLLASSDAVSLDAVCSEMIGLPFARYALLREVTARGLGNGRIDNIEVVGVDPGSIRIKDFILPKTEFLYRFPSFIGKHLANVIYFRPMINEVLCKKCNICKHACPVDAITINKDTSKIDTGLCVKCFCCHEVCPHDAIDIKKNYFARLIWQK